MLTTESIAQALQDPSATNGWDAVFAMNLEQVNALFFQEFLEIGSTNNRAETLLRCALSDGDTSMLILDATLGPPSLSVQAQDSTAKVEMELMSGALVTLDLNTLAFVSAALVRPNESKLTGPLTLAKVKGEVNQLGAVVMDLGASAYSPTVSGIDPASVLNTRLGDAARTYFRDNAATYTLGIIGNEPVAPSLTPTSFRVTTQKHPTKPDSCVLLLIKTDGQEGPVAPLAEYPIPDDAKVALLISQPSLFGALSNDLDNTFSPFGTKFSRKQAENVSWIVGSGGAITSGPFGTQYYENQWNEYYNAGQPPWTSDAGGNLAAVQMPLSGFNLTVSSGQLVAAWTTQFSQEVTGLMESFHFNPKGEPVVFTFSITSPSTLEIDYSCTGGTPTVDPASSKVSFAFSSPSVSLKVVEEPSGWEQFWCQARTYTDEMIEVSTKALLNTLKSFTLATIDAFRLKSLLFQSPHTVQLTKAALPNGVYLTGNAVMPIAVTPATTTVPPGGTVQFTATAPGQAKIMWQSKPIGVGSIDRDTGVYKAPASISSAQIVVVTAIDSADLTVHGSAMALVANTPAPQGVDVQPAMSLVAPGHIVRLSTTDATGRALTATWTLSPSTGSVKQGRKQGEYMYVAPGRIDEVTDVILQAVNTANAAETGTATVRVMPPSTIDVQPANATVNFGAKLALTATVDTGDADKLRWVVYPADSGTVVADHDDPKKATYTAPAEATSGNIVTIVAYLVDDDTAGSGSTTITLPS
ncbi:hypothetical protein AB0K14_19500 [Actinosynnema sp. NPDC050801]|uniref:hypothetical protein n=1 Tax=unclassified Actinosynnema TaxID=2637065 RepID=UPI0033F1C687